MSISIDAIEDKEIWEDMISEKNMEGVQLYANGDKQILDGYGIETIPRFILLDEEGTIIDNDTYQPSDPFLTESLNALLR